MSWNNIKESEEDDGYRTVDDEDYSDEDDYEPIEIGAWGDNSSKEAPTWNNLIDPSVKLKAGGIGSGDLHRRGGNFKPLSEATILAQRLSKPIPGKKTGPKPQGPSKTSGAAGRRRKQKTLAKPAIIRTAPRPPIPVKSYQPPERKPLPNAPPSTWGSKPLVETPFWEVKKEAAAAATATTAPPSRSPPGLNYNPNPPPPKMSGFSFVNPDASKWNTAGLTAPPPRQPPGFQSNTNTNGDTASAAPSVTKWGPLNDHAGYVPNGQVNTPTRNTYNTPTSFVQILENKPVKLSAPTTPSPAQQQRQKPYFNIDLEIGNGISATVTLYNDSDPKQMAEEFGKKHNLIVTDLAKYNLASIFQKLLNGKREKEQRLLQQQQQ